MGACRAHGPTGQARRPQAHDRRARDFERNFLRAVDRLPMAGAAQRPAAEEHSVGLFRPVDLGWHAGAHPSRALCGGTRAGGTGGKPDHGEGRAKRGALLDPQGFDAGKKITGRKRHILVDTLGLLLSVAVHPANIQDRDGVALVLDRRTRRLFPFIERIYGDGGYQGPKAAKAAAKTGCWTIEIVERSSTAVGFEVLPKRWIVERTFAWLSRFRRLARDFERYARTVAAFIHLAMIRIMLQRLVASSSS